MLVGQDYRQVCVGAGWQVEGIGKGGHPFMGSEEGCPCRQEKQISCEVQDHEAGAGEQRGERPAQNDIWKTRCGHAAASVGGYAAPGSKRRGAQPASLRVQLGPLIAL